MYTPAVRVQGTVPFTVHHDFTVQVAVLVEALLHLNYAFHRHGLTLGVQVAVPDDALVFVVPPLYRDDALGVRGNITVDIIVGFRSYIPRFIEGPVDSAVAVLEQHRLFPDAKPALGNLLLGFVVHRDMLTPAVRMEGLIAFSIQHDLTVQVAIFIVALLHLDHAVHGHGLTLGVQVAVPDDMSRLVIASLDDDNAILVRRKLQRLVVERLTNNMTAVIVGHLAPRKALGAKDALAALVDVVFLDQAIVLGKCLNRIDAFGKAEI